VVSCISLDVLCRSRSSRRGTTTRAWRERTRVRRALRKGRACSEHSSGFVRLNGFCRFARALCGENHPAGEGNDGESIYRAFFSVEAGNRDRNERGKFRALSSKASRDLFDRFCNLHRIHSIRNESKPDYRERSKRLLFSEAVCNLGAGALDARNFAWIFLSRYSSGRFFFSADRFLAAIDACATYNALNHVRRRYRFITRSD